MRSLTQDSANHRIGNAVIVAVTLATIVPLSAPWIALGTGVPQSGGTATATLTVTAHVIRNCMVSATPIAFGNYDPLVTHRTQPLDASGYVIVACTKGVAPTVELDVGANSQGVSRRMSSGGDFLSYEIYFSLLEIIEK